ncbi:MAG TPA: hypothetical protein VKQ32_15385, partial [Polyangia bacterium]|nr:hypothetical protein [Polyangia bacterium]
MKRACAILAAAAATLFADVALANQPPMRPCDRLPASRQGFPPVVASKLARLMRQMTAAVPRTVRGSRCSVDFGEIPGVRLREACWKEPDEVITSVTCESSSPRAHTWTAVIIVTLSMVPVDYQTEGKILESTPDLLATAPEDFSSATLIFGARGDPWISDHGTMRRETGWAGSHKLENANQGPFIIAVAVAIRSVSAD